MLGREVRDPSHVESSLERVDGLGMLDVTTTMNPEKLTAQAQARVLAEKLPFAFSGELAGYEIHQGETKLGENAQPLFEIVKRSDSMVHVLDGAISPDGKVWGTYLHGLFDNDAFRLAFISHLQKEKGFQTADTLGNYQFEHEKQRQYDQLAQAVREHLNIDNIYKIMGL